MLVVSSLSMRLCSFLPLPARSLVNIIYT
jgi:hypothetical protein